MPIDSRRIITCWTLIALSAITTFARAADRPNFVWIVSEDNSKHYLKMFDPAGAPTPHIEKLAEHGIVFDRAFSCSPVCSAARTTLATAVYAPRIFTQFHRKTKPAVLPNGWRMFPAYLRDAGYYATNNAKKDYNAVEGKGVWDASSRKANWRHRPKKDTPFFHMQSYGNSHESSLHFPAKEVNAGKLTTDASKVTLGPYHPDTKIFRYTYGAYHDRIRAIDDIVGNVVDQLKEDGLLEDTFVFYFGDHGGVLPRGKGYIYESGLHVPLVVRIPEKWKHLSDMKPGCRTKGFVSFVDFGPTLLHLAGVAVPKHMDGRPFLGKGVTAAEIASRDETFGYADRFDEKYEFVRSLRKGRYKYMRNYEAHYPDGLQNNYRYRMLAYSQWRAMYRDGKLNAAQRQFFEPKAAEALYDIEADPHEVSNLADDPRHRELLMDLRSRLAARVRSLPDLSFYPENVLLDEALSNPHQFATARKDEIAALADIADLSLLPFGKAKPGLIAALGSQRPWHRYWGLIACSVFGKEAESLADKARPLLKDSESLVRVRAAEFLGRIRAADPRPTLMDVLRNDEHPLVAALTLNTVVYLKDGGPNYTFTITRKDVRAKGDSVKRRLEYLVK